MIVESTPLLQSHTGTVNNLHKCDVVATLISVECRVVTFLPKLDLMYIDKCKCMEHSYVAKLHSIKIVSRYHIASTE